MLKEATAHLAQHPHRVLQGPARRLRPRPRRRRDREGPARGLRLRLRAPDGADEPAPVGHRHLLHLDEPAALVPVVEPGARGRALRRRRVGHGAASTSTTGSSETFPQKARGSRWRAERARGRTREGARHRGAARPAARHPRGGALELPMSASVLDQPRRVRRDPPGRDRRAARGAARGALAAEGARPGPRAGRARGRAASSTRPGCGPSAWSRAPRSCGRRGGPAEEILDDAERQAAAIRHEAEDYVDRKLAAFEVVLDRTMQTVAEGPRAAPGARARRTRTCSSPTPTRPSRPSSTRTRL